MARNSGNKNYDILDKILNDSQTHTAGGQWIVDKNHPDGGYWMTDSTEADRDAQQKATNDIERYLRS
jgi:hypothetical protein